MVRLQLIEERYWRRWEPLLRRRRFFLHALKVFLGSPFGEGLVKVARLVLGLSLPYSMWTWFYSPPRWKTQFRLAPMLFLPSFSVYVGNICRRCWSLQCLWQGYCFHVICHYWVSSPHRPDVEHEQMVHDSSWRALRRCWGYVSWSASWQSAKFLNNCCFH